MKPTTKVLHLGGERQVTGSCHLLQTNGLNILVDCGLAQGRDTVTPMDRWPVAPSKVDFLFLTHAHIDHAGRIPELIRKGFRGEIITTHASKALLGPMLRDTMALGRMSRPDMDAFSEAIDELCWGFEYGEAFDLRKGVKFKLGRAGHILGSCFVRFEAEGGAWSGIFSGDLGAKDTPILPDPDPPEPSDLLVLESTYGNRSHEDRKERAQRLGKVFERALSDGGKVFIPAFALGRTQELLYEMDRLFSRRGDESSATAARLQAQRSSNEAVFAPGASADSGPNPMNPSNPSNPSSLRSPFPVFVDSPLGLEITEIYSRLSEYWDKEAKDFLSKGDNPIDFERLYAVRNQSEHLRLVREISGPCAILAGSGMCTGGRIVDHLVDGLPDPRNDVFFVGYQAEGTPGREIIENADQPNYSVVLNGAPVPLRARIHVLCGYSAHADQRGLVEWVKAMGKKPKAIKLVHGEPEAQRSLAAVLEKMV